MRDAGELSLTAVQNRNPAPGDPGGRVVAGSLAPGHHGPGPPARFVPVPHSNPPLGVPACGMLEAQRP